MPDLSTPSSSTHRRAAGYIRPRILLVACMLALGTAHTAAHAQQRFEEAATHSFSVPAGTLAEALHEFERTTGLAIEENGHATGILASAGAKGRLTDAQALSAILAGTGLQARQRADGHFVLQPRDAAQPTGELAGVTVVGVRQRGEMTPRPYAGGQVADGAHMGMLGNRNVFDTPFNVTSFSDKLIRDQQAHDMSDVFLNDASVHAVGDSRYGVNNFFYVRGLDMSGFDASWNGLYGLVNGRRQGLVGAESVELLKGPSALMNGMSPQQSVGGAVNFAPKRAGDTPLARLELQYANRSTGGISLDAGRRFGRGNAFGARVNLGYLDGATALDHNASRNRDAAIALDYRSARWRASLDIVHSDQSIEAPLRGYGLGIDTVPKPPKSSTNAHQRWEYYHNKADFVAGRVDYTPNDALDIYATYGTARHGESSVGTIYRIVDAAGTATGELNAPEATDVQITNTGELGLHLKFATGALRHQVSASLSAYRDSAYTYAGYTGIQSIYQPVRTNIYHPVAVAQQFYIRENMTHYPWYRAEKNGIALADTIATPNARLMVTFGVRHQQLADHSYDFYSPGQPSFGKEVDANNDHAWTPLYAVVWKPTATVSIYANRVEGLQSGATAPQGTRNQYQRFPPYRTHQTELGAKADFGAFGLTAALYQIKVPHSMIDASNVFSQGGEQRNRGLELNVFGEPATGWRLLGGYTLSDAVITKATGNENVGRTVSGVPRHQLNLYSEYDWPGVPGLVLDARIIHTSRQFVDEAERLHIPAWTRLDAGMRYTFANVFGRTLTTRLQVENLLGQDYWASAAFGRLEPSAPRTLKLSATIDF